MAMFAAARNDTMNRPAGPKKKGPGTAPAAYDPEMRKSFRRHLAIKLENIILDCLVRPELERSIKETKAQQYVLPSLLKEEDDTCAGSRAPEMTEEGSRKRTQKRRIVFAHEYPDISREEGPGPKIIRSRIERKYQNWMEKGKKVAVVQLGSCYMPEQGAVEEAAVYQEYDPVFWKTTLYPCLLTPELCEDTAITGHSSGKSQSVKDLSLVVSPGIRMRTEQLLPGNMMVMTVLLPWQSSALPQIMEPEEEDDLEDDFDNWISGWNIDHNRPDPFELLEHGGELKQTGILAEQVFRKIVLTSQMHNCDILILDIPRLMVIVTELFQMQLMPECDDNKKVRLGQGLQPNLEEILFVSLTRVLSSCGEDIPAVYLWDTTASGKYNERKNDPGVVRLLTGEKAGKEKP